MLFNPRWSKKSKDLTVANFLLWAETQDPDEKYDYLDCFQCACGQWLRACGVSESNIGKYNTYWKQNREIMAINYAAALSPRTFGALASRLRERV